MNRLSTDKQILIVSALVNGMGVRQTARHVGVDQNTVMKYLVRAGQKCQLLMDVHLRNFHSVAIECDECWTFVHTKEDHMKASGRRHDTWGDEYCFYGICATTKIIPTYVVGKRDTGTALEFMARLKKKLVSCPRSSRNKS